MTGPHPTRRRVLAGAAATSIAALAGCTNLPGEATDEPSYERLPTTPVYLADGVDLTLPDEVETVDGPANADLLVLPDDTDVSADRAVEWLADERAVALLGDGAQDTWLDWTEDDAYISAFGDQGRAEANPAPQLLVGAYDDGLVTTYRKTWGNGPDDQDVLAELDEVLVDLAATPTPD